jgi:hypothetical protein
MTILHSLIGFVLLLALACYLSTSSTVRLHPDYTCVKQADGWTLCTK